MKSLICKLYNSATGIRGLGLGAVYFLIICAVYYYPQMFDSLAIYSSASRAWQNITGQHLFMSTFDEVFFLVHSFLIFFALLIPPLGLMLWARENKDSPLKLRQYHVVIALLPSFLAYMFVYHAQRPLADLVRETYDPVQYWLDGGSLNPISIHDVEGHRKRDETEKADLLHAGPEAVDRLIAAAQAGPDQDMMDQYKNRAGRIYDIEQISDADMKLSGGPSAKIVEDDHRLDLGRGVHNRQSFVDMDVSGDIRFYRYNAIHALSLIGDDKAIAALKSLVQADDKLIASDALSALRNLDPVFFAATRQALHDDYMATHPKKP